MPEPLTMDVAAVAAALGLCPAYFRRRLPELISQHGFPRPLPGLKQPRFSRWAVEAWVKGEAAPAADVVAAAPAPRAQHPALRALSGGRAA